MYALNRATALAVSDRPTVLQTEIKMFADYVVDRNLPSRQIRPETQTTSRLFSRWFTTVRTARLMIVRGGGSGAPSPIEITSFGSETLASSLHQEIWATKLARNGTGIVIAYTLVFHDCVLYCQPARSHNLPLQNE